MLVHRLRRYSWPNIKPTPVQRHVFAGKRLIEVVSAFKQRQFQ